MEKTRCNAPGEAHPAAPASPGRREGARSGTGPEAPRDRSGRSGRHSASRKTGEIARFHRGGEGARCCPCRGSVGRAARVDEIPVARHATGIPMADSGHARPFPVLRRRPHPAARVAVLRPTRPAVFWPKSPCFVHSRRGWVSAFRWAWPGFSGIFRDACRRVVRHCLACPQHTAGIGKFRPVSAMRRAPSRVPDGLAQPASAGLPTVDMLQG